MVPRPINHDRPPADQLPSSAAPPTQTHTCSTAFTSCAAGRSWIWTTPRCDRVPSPCRSAGCFLGLTPASTLASLKVRAQLVASDSRLGVDVVLRPRPAGIGPGHLQSVQPCPVHGAHGACRQHGRGARRCWRVAVAIISARESRTGTSARSSIQSRGVRSSDGPPFHAGRLRTREAPGVLSTRACTLPIPARTDLAGEASTCVLRAATARPATRLRGSSEARRGGLSSRAHGVPGSVLSNCQPITPTDACRAHDLGLRPSHRRTTGTWRRSAARCVQRTQVASLCCQALITPRNTHAYMRPHHLRRPVLLLSLCCASRSSYCLMDQADIVMRRVDRAGLSSGDPAGSAPPALDEHPPRNDPDRSPPAQPPRCVSPRGACRHVYTGGDLPCVARARSSGPGRIAYFQVIVAESRGDMVRRSCHARVRPRFRSDWRGAALVNPRVIRRGDCCAIPASHNVGGAMPAIVTTVAGSQADSAIAVDHSPSWTGRRCAWEGRAAHAGGAARVLSNAAVSPSLGHVLRQSAVCARRVATRGSLSARFGVDIVVPPGPAYARRRRPGEVSPLGSRHSASALMRALPWRSTRSTARSSSEVAQVPSSTLGGGDSERCLAARRRVARCVCVCPVLRRDGEAAVAPGRR
jgi:hypothetical protein